MFLVAWYTTPSRGYYKCGFKWAINPLHGREIGFNALNKLLSKSLPWEETLSLHIISSRERLRRRSGEEEEDQEQKKNYDARKVPIGT